MQWWAVLDIAVEERVALHSLWLVKRGGKAEQFILQDPLFSFFFHTQKVIAAKGDKNYSIKEGQVGEEQT